MGSLILALLLLLTQASAEETLSEKESCLPDGRPSLYRIKEGEEDLFLPAGSEPIITESSYQSENMYITLTKGRYEADSTVKKTVYHSSASYAVADFYIRDLACLSRIYASGKFGNTSARIADMARANEAVLAVNGDYASELSQGVVISNGIVKRKTRNQKRDMCLIMKDGSMRILPYGTSLTYSQMIDKGLIGEDDVWQCFLFGPSLIDENGEAYPNSVLSKKTDVNPYNPRTILGYYEPGHYCLVVVDGRQTKSRGLRLEVSASFMQELGCNLAYNLDGGQSSAMWYLDRIITDPYRNGRKVNDILILSEPADSKD